MNGSLGHTQHAQCSMLHAPCCMRPVFCGGRGRSKYVCPCQPAGGQTLKCQQWLTVSTAPPTSCLHFITDGVPTPSPEPRVQDPELGVHHSRSGSHKKAQIYIYIDWMMPMGWAFMERVLLTEFDWFRVRAQTPKEKDIFHIKQINPKHKSFQYHILKIYLMHEAGYYF